ncbi:MAG: Ig-like domain-containing protein, partial [Myxococcota bacterium]|nr:Ig-like domain-containing protein [Myxococcota bacterium]
MNTKIWIFLLAGLACNSDNAAKIVNSAPEATITVPSNGDTLMEGETVFLRGTVSDNNHANDEL